MRQRIVYLTMEHLCSIDHMIPKQFLFDAENMEGELELDKTKLELMKSLDQMCSFFIQYTERVTQSGTRRLYCYICLLPFRRQNENGPCPSNRASWIYAHFRKSISPSTNHQIRSICFVLYFEPQSLISWFVYRLAYKKHQIPVGAHFEAPGSSGLLVWPLRTGWVCFRKYIVACCQNFGYILYEGMYFYISW